MALTDKLTAIGDAIRGKTGSTDLLTLDGMAAAIAGIETGGGGGDGLVYDMGEFVLDADTVSGNTISVPHNLGASPEFICVWTDNWAGLTSDEPVTYGDAKPTAVGFVWLEEITGMVFRASSVASGTPMCLAFTITNGDYRVGGALPTSAAYGVLDGFVSKTAFSPPTYGINGARYRAGVTYKYFVTKAWWSVGGVASAE